jgi:hypothetical protein
LYATSILVPIVVVAASMTRSPPSIASEHRSPHHRQRLPTLRTDGALDHVVLDQLQPACVCQRVFQDECDGDGLLRGAPSRRPDVCGVVARFTERVEQQPKVGAHHRSAPGEFEQPGRVLGEPSGVGRPRQVVTERLDGLNERHEPLAVGEGFSARGAEPISKPNSDGSGDRRVSRLSMRSGQVTPRGG